MAWQNKGRCLSPGRKNDSEMNGNFNDKSLVIVAERVKGGRQGRVAS